MMTEETRQLLRKFSGERSEAAFRELVRQHSPLVYGTALRMLAGDRAAAQDVTQEVFTLLARKAGSLGGVVLGAWLYRQTCRRASNHVRTETRRKQRELVAAAQMNPDASHDSALIESLGGEVDAALQGLPAPDRDALVLRYFEGQDFRKLGASLGTTEEAARKRVARAVEKLATSLRKRGIAVGSTALGATMTNLGAAPVPSTLVEHVTAHAFGALSSAASPWTAKLLKPAAAGVLATSLIAGTTLALQESRHAAQPVATAGNRQPLEDSKLSASDSLEDLIAEIKRLHNGPRHALTTLRLRAVLERVEINRLPDFFLVAHARLTPAEQASPFKLLLERWMQSDPDAALTFMVGNPLWKEVNASEGTSLLVNLFEPWARRDVRAAQSWLLLHWHDEELNENPVGGTLGGTLAIKIADQLLQTESASASLAFIASIPDESARSRALRGLSGDSLWANGWMNVSDARLMELHRGLVDLPDPVLGQSRAAALWRNLLVKSPEKVARLENSLAPADRFIVQIASLGVTRPIIVPMANGGEMHYLQEPKGLTTGEEMAVKAGLAAGLSRAEALEAIATTVLHWCPPNEVLRWIDRHHGEVHLDALLLEKVRGLRGLVGSVTEWIPGDSPEEQIIQWASRMSDTATSHPICRAAFRRLLLCSRDEALGLLNRDNLPAPLKADLEAILNEPQ